MKKYHSIFHEWTPEDVQYLSQFGLKAKVGYMWIYIEDESTYRTVTEHYKALNVDYLDYSKNGYYSYSKEEVLAAPYCYLANTSYACGYPKPENSYVTKTFDTSQMCQRCNVGRKQDRPFHVSKLSKSGFWTFYGWETGTYFVSDEVYETVFAPYGIQRIPVVMTSGKIAEGVSQLQFPVAEESLDFYSYRYKICPQCGVKRYLLDEVWKHPYFPLHRSPIPGAFIIKEVFGEGAIVDYPLLLSAEVVKKLLSMKLVDLGSLIPCAPDIEQYWGAKSLYDTDALCGVEE